MKLFAKKKNNKIVEQDAMSAILNPETLTINAEPASTPELEKIIKTTESLNIVSAINNSHPDAQSGSKNQKSELGNVREAIYRSFDLARRKIATEYEQIIVSGNYVDNPFLAVQIVVKNYDKKWNVEYVESVVKKFTDAIPEHLSLGKTIFITDDLVIEPIMYVDKLLPSWKITPNFALLTNALKWEDIVEKLMSNGELSQDSKEIILELIDAISMNIKNGYYVKLSRLVLLQLYPGAAQKIVLFSNDTLQKMNEIYARFLKTGERKQINKYDTISHFERTQENIKNSFLTTEAIEAVDKVEFIPRDLTEEIPQELSEQEKQEIQKEKLQDEIESAKNAVEIEIEVENTKEDKKPEFDTNELIIKEVKKQKNNNDLPLISSPEVTIETEEKVEVIKEVEENGSSLFINDETPAEDAKKVKKTTKKVTKTVEIKKAEVKPAVKPVAKKPAKIEETQEFNLVEKALTNKKPATVKKAEVKPAVKPVAKKPTPKKK